MADDSRLTHLKVLLPNGSYTSEIPISVLASNIIYDVGSPSYGQTLADALGNILYKTKGPLQVQISRIQNDVTDLKNGAGISQQSISNAVSSWLVENITPGSGGAVVDATLTTSGAAADAKAAGDMFMISDTQPSASTNKLWFKSSSQSVELPTIEELENIIAPKYSSTSTYNIGDYVLYNNNSTSYKLYKCNTTISAGESWTPAHWTQTTIMNEIKQLSN